MRWAGFVARMGQKRNTHRIFVMPERKTLLERSKRGWEDNIKMHLREEVRGGMGWILLAQGTD
jgi:hypothetical protein